MPLGLFDESEFVAVSLTAQMKDLRGNRTGRLVALRPCRKIGKGRHTYWQCQCDCGNRPFVIVHSLRIGHTQSCGCATPELMLKACSLQGLSKTPAYRSWLALKQRCENKADAN